MVVPAAGQVAVRAKVAAFVPEYGLAPEQRSQRTKWTGRICGKSEPKFPAGRLIRVVVKSLRKATGYELHKSWKPRHAASGSRAARAELPGCHLSVSVTHRFLRRG
jgi:hypothetical protein